VPSAQPRSVRYAGRAAWRGSLKSGLAGMVRSRISWPRKYTIPVNQTRSRAELCPLYSASSARREGRASGTGGSRPRWRLIPMEIRPHVSASLVMANLELGRMVRGWHEEDRWWSLLLEPKRLRGWLDARCQGSRVSPSLTKRRMAYRDRGLLEEATSRDAS